MALPSLTDGLFDVLALLFGFAQRGLQPPALIPVPGRGLRHRSFHAPDQRGHVGAEDVVPDDRKQPLLHDLSADKTAVAAIHWGCGGNVPGRSICALVDLSAN